MVRWDQRGGYAIAEEIPLLLFTIHRESWLPDKSTCYSNSLILTEQNNLKSSLAFHRKKSHYKKSIIL